jgi:hypothetical protein
MDAQPAYKASSRLYLILKFVEVLLVPSWVRKDLSPYYELAIGLKSILQTFVNFSPIARTTGITHTNKAGRHIFKDAAASSN